MSGPQILIIRISVWLTPWFCKYFTGTQPHLFVHVLPMAAFLLHRHHWIVKVSMWPMRLKYLPFGLLQKTLLTPELAYNTGFLQLKPFFFFFLKTCKKSSSYHLQIPASYFYLPFEQSLSTSAVESICKFHANRHKHHLSYS